MPEGGTGANGGKEGEMGSSRSAGKAEGEGRGRIQVKGEGALEEGGGWEEKVLRS